MGRFWLVAIRARCYLAAMDVWQQHTPLDADTCRKARLSRDPRFDGEFYLGVTTTGIYCRPVCPARVPAEKNVRYFRHAAQAAEAGFRPCLRCRPETAPDSPARAGSVTTVNRALQLIRGGALNNGGSIPALADRLGVGDRYLRKLFQRELGLSPHAVAHNHRLLMARQLIAETSLPLTDIASASGFGSLRRFNSAIRAAYGVPASTMRRRKPGRGAPDAIRLELRYRAPYDWDGVIDYFRRHAVEGIETVEDSCYRRTLSVGQSTGSMTIAPKARANSLELSLQLPHSTNIMPLISGVRRMFDLDANPSIIGASLAADEVIGGLWQSTPGIRSPGCWSPAESSVRAIVGQQVSTVAARSICGRFATACAGPSQALAFPTPAQIAALDDDQFPMPGNRRDTLRRLGQAGISHDMLDTDELAELKGVGPWTVAMVAMRGLGNPDVFPASDLGLIRAWEQLGGDRKALTKAQEKWRPWRSYVANLLWRSLS